jgi:acetyltransferase-like isoleucine patch superfamily enzyme
MFYLKEVYKFLAGVAAFLISFYYLALILIGIPYRDVSIKVSSFGGLFGIKIRQYYYKKTLKKFGDNVVIAKGSYIVYRDCEIGNQVAIEEDCVVSLCVIEDYVILAHRVSLMSGGNQHELDDLSLNFRDSILPLEKIRVGRNVWIGVHAVVMSDVAAGTAVAAGAVVTKKFCNNAVIGGVPAKVIRMRGHYE